MACTERFSEPNLSEWQCVQSPPVLGTHFFVNAIAYHTLTGRGGSALTGGFLALSDNWTDEA